ncbi:UDP-N-acetylglucosamine--N-acetylmuramyl-(pentapeptide) pyrophosphoryl-undecaprenol N-acetylglucosamine transferase [Arcanobacterium hippocoleae]|uniref:UDP-N-acetylglucosamine--N-acetylmuramyl- (pentapeptide) pyrophosphoryl-undecaprenol N-acetylglucosamine transferase n=1 Tax=Arcanobacterium hippocoleae TaxID=149017 RepID=UPI003341CDA2
MQADTVVGFGGYVSPPVYLAARKRKLRIVVHEGNARPGIANRLGARFAQFVALSFQSTPLRAKRGKTVLTGLPIRFEIRDLANTLQQQTADALRNQMAVKYGFDPALPVLVVTGGSLGAQHINEVVAQCAQEILDRGFQVLHLTGKDKSASVKAQIAGVQGNYRVLEYVTEMNEIYAFADLIISRSGAGMVSEICALGIPAVFVPLPIGNGEQALNAADVVASGGAILITDANFTPDELRRQVLPLLNHDLRKQMASRMRQVAHADAAGQLAAIILQ